MKHNTDPTPSRVTARAVDPGESFDRFSHAMMGAVSARDTDEALFELAVAAVFGATYADVEGLAVQSAYLLAITARDTHRDAEGVV